MNYYLRTEVEDMAGLGAKILAGDRDDVDLYSGTIDAWLVNAKRIYNGLL